MLPSYYSKELNHADARRYIHRQKISIPIAASASTIDLFRVPSGYNFYMYPFVYDGDSTGKCVLFNNLTTAGAFSVAFTNAGEYNTITSGIPTLVSIYTNGTAANSPRAFDMVALTTTRIYQTQNTLFNMRYTNTSTAFTLILILSGFLVPA